MAQGQPIAVVRPFRPADAAWVVEQHGSLYTAEQGWDERFAEEVRAIVGGLMARAGDPGEAGWIAELDGRSVGCVFCARASETTALLRALLVEPQVRGQGIGTGLVQHCVEFARAAGYARVELWTTANLLAAQALYDDAGFELIEEWDEHRFGHVLTSRRLALAL